MACKFAPLTTNHLVGAKSKIDRSYLCPAGFHCAQVLKLFCSPAESVSEQRAQRQVRTGLKEKRGVGKKRRCSALLSGSSVVLRVWWPVSVNTCARYTSSAIAKMVDEVSVCVCKCISSSAVSVSGVRVSVTVQTHTHKWSSSKAFWWLGLVLKDQCDQIL